MPAMVRLRHGLEICDASYSTSWNLVKTSPEVLHIHQFISEPIWLVLGDATRRGQTHNISEGAFKISPTLRNVSRLTSFSITGGA